MTSPNGIIQKRMTEAGYNKNTLAKSLGISRASLYNKLKDTGSFTLSELSMLGILLGFSRNDIMEIYKYLCQKMCQNP